jgi:non-ribosomal peptide synthetase component F
MNLRLLQWSDKTDYDKYVPGKIHEHFMCQANEHADRIAIVANDGEAEEAYTYGQMYQMCLQLAMQLQKDYGVGYDMLVPLLFERSAWQVVAVYGVLFAGGAYVPLEPHYPRERIGGILEEVSPVVCLAGQNCAAPLLVVEPGQNVQSTGLWSVLSLGPGHGGQNSMTVDILQRGEARASRDELASDIDGSGLVYCFFTSGSTGKPKGVMCEHSGLRHRIEWMQANYQMQAGDCTVLKHAYTFGISEWELFWPLSIGGTLIVPKPGGEKDPEYIFRLCASFRVTVMYFVPSMLNMLLDYMQAESKCPIEAGLVLKQVITCGEPLVEATIQQFFKLFRTAELDNLYGPTEGSMTVWRCPRGCRIRTVPIGKPIDGIRAYSLAQGRLAEINVPGEVHFAGRFIARGYLGCPRQQNVLS